MRTVTAWVRVPESPPGPPRRRGMLILGLSRPGEREFLFAGVVDSVEVNCMGAQYLEWREGEILPVRTIVTRMRAITPHGSMDSRGTRRRRSTTCFRIDSLP